MDEQKITLPKDLQLEMMKFFLKTSIPRKKREQQERQQQEQNQKQATPLSKQR